MIDLSKLVQALTERGIWVDAGRSDKDRYGNDHNFENPIIYPYGFEIYFSTYTVRQRKDVGLAAQRAWFAFRGKGDTSKVLLAMHEVSRAAGTRRYSLSVAWRHEEGQNKDDIDILGQMFIDTLTEEFKAPYSSPILKEALMDDLANKIADAKKEAQKDGNTSNSEDNIPNDNVPDVAVSTES
jgi:hypothetical protein